MPARKGPDFVFAAKYRTQCPVCKEFVYEGDNVLFPTKDAKYVIHEACYAKLPTPSQREGARGQDASPVVQSHPLATSPRPATSVGVEGPKEGSYRTSPALGAGSPPAVPSPRPATSVGVEGPKPGAGAGGGNSLSHPAPAAVPVPAQAVIESPELAERVFVQIAGWVPSDKADIVVKAIIEARR
jgi:hypothetical protein